MKRILLGVEDGRITLSRRDLVCMVASRADDRRRGLEGISLGLYEGMLFVFPSVAMRKMHMGAVEYPIDIFFADANGVIGFVARNCQPGSSEIWTAPAEIVLETRAGVL